MITFNKAIAGSPYYSTNNLIYRSGNHIYHNKEVQQLDVHCLIPKDPWL